MITIGRFEDVNATGKGAAFALLEINAVSAAARAFSPVEISWPAARHESARNIYNRIDFRIIDTEGESLQFANIRLKSNDIMYIRYKERFRVLTVQKPLNASLRGFFELTRNYLET